MFPNVNITFQNSSPNPHQQPQPQQQQQRNFHLQHHQIQNTPTIQTQQQFMLQNHQSVPFWQHNQELLLRRQYARFQQQQQQQQQQLQLEFQQRYQLPMRQPPPGFNLWGVKMEKIIVDKKQYLVNYYTDGIVHSKKNMRLLKFKLQIATWYMLKI